MQQYDNDASAQATYTYTTGFQPRYDGPGVQPPQYNQPSQQETAYQQGYGQYGQPSQQVPPYEGGADSYRIPQPPPFSYMVPPIQINVFPPAYHQTGENGKFLAAMSYLGLWLSGFMLILFVRKNRFIRFHAMQSLLIFGGVNVVYIVFASLMSFHHHLGLIIVPIVLAFVLVNIFAIVAWFVGMFGALSGKYIKLPFVGDIAERYANGPARVK